MLKTNDLFIKKMEAERKRLEAGAVNRVVKASGTTGSLDPNLLVGLRQAVRNSQQRLALEYLVEVVEAQAAQISELQDYIESRNEDTKEAPAEPDMPAGPIPKPEPTKEAEPVEERKKQRPAPKPKTEEEPAE